MDAISRRTAVKAAVGGAIAWSAPMVVADRAFATLNTGTPKCRPQVSVSCIEFYCQQGQKYFPGITINASACPCGTGPIGSIGCIKVGTITRSDGKATFFYDGAQTCDPGGGCNIPPSTWTPIGTGGNTFYLGEIRSGGGTPCGNGAIPNTVSATYTFSFCIYAGPCHREGLPDSSVCQWYDFSGTWSSSNDSWNGSCSITPRSGPTFQCGCESGRPC